MEKSGLDILQSFFCFRSKKNILQSNFVFHRRKSDGFGTDEQITEFSFLSKIILLTTCKNLDIEQKFGTFVHFSASLVPAAVVLCALHANMSEGHLFITI